MGKGTERVSDGCDEVKAAVERKEFACIGTKEPFVKVRYITIYKE